MSYQQVIDDLREELIWLLTKHRVTQALGGPGSVRVPITSTVGERLEFGVEIQRYRAVILRYALQSLRASNPNPRFTSKELAREPILRLHRGLIRATLDLPVEPALSDLLGRTPRYPLIQHWQSAGRAAAQAERELAALPWGEMSMERKRVIHRDAADISRALATLEGRYLNVPGWTPFPGRARLLALANGAKQHLSELAIDPSVGEHGWRPRPGRIEGPPLPGLAGVLQAQHNVLVGLMEFPNAMNLRKILAEQAQLSGRLAAVAGRVDADIAGVLEERKLRYRDLMLAARTVGGEIGGGRDAALESSFAVGRVPARLGPSDRDALVRLASLGERVDGRVSAAIEHGFEKELYLVAAILPDFDAPAQGMVRRGRTRWSLANDDVPLLTLVRDVGRNSSRIRRLESAGTARSRPSESVGDQDRPGWSVRR